MITCTCSSVPLCEAHITASSRSVNPKRSIPPPSTSGSTWNGLDEERKKTNASGSPSEATSLPLTSHTASAP
jgi:hypothetical protein